MNPLVVAFILLVLLEGHVVLAFEQYQELIPNGNAVYHEDRLVPGVGHDSALGGGRLNQFGKDFRAAGRVWTDQLCRKDSDGDGKTNGEELGDPKCEWKPGAPAPNGGRAISHPGIKDELSCLDMRIGVLGGTGQVGQRFATALRTAGFQVKVGSRNATGIDRTKLLNPEIEVETNEEAARWGDILVMAFPSAEAALATIPSLPPSVRHKIVIDLMNPIRFDKVANEAVWDPPAPGTSLSLVLQKALGGNAKVVKAFNAFGAEHYNRPSKEKKVFLAGDEVEAKSVVGDIVETLGFTPLDLGSLKGFSGALENLATMWVQIARSKKNRDFVFGTISG